MEKKKYMPSTPSTTMDYAAIIPGKDGHINFNRNLTSSDFYKPEFFDENFSWSQEIDSLDYLKRGLNKIKDFILSQ